MDYKKIIQRLKKSEYKSLEVLSIKRELRNLSITERTVILGKLQEEKYKSDNSDVNDVIDDIIQEFKPKK
ncbi:hypothetical protein OOZ15_12425 [Galbibacter sp. EGI 63066]|uniref:hypothetical protein n=1 Tax=Galbibacter sp. EGI 63066 TaxID=2993559 RepID=UPI00224890AE|nr:hypothetical protein [Galbibacter sp. EGI 63066]MCX2680750.1 hypothetical protein [Galbibacter sp. EGI 63066]